ncbi:MAG: DinB family protein [Gemmatimonadota bacterium]|jgi:hypothetical protein|nr:DinB family protein [Gemmatimonadota bacterium]
MRNWTILREQSTTLRAALADLIADEEDRADIIPATWNNNLRWHVGHLITSPLVLTWGLMGEPLPIPPRYREWFGRGSSPRGWGDAEIPPFTSLVQHMGEVIPALFDAFDGRAGQAFPKPYTTTVGIMLRTPVDALHFSMVHDGMHYGMIEALKRSLNAESGGHRAG